MLATNNRNLFSAGLIIIGLGLFPFSAIGQDNKETAAQMVEIGDEIFNQTLALMEARYIYISAVNMDPDNIRANYMAGLTTLLTIDKGEATRYFLNVLELDPEYSFDILYKIGQAYHYDYKFDDAINYYSRYQQKLAGTSEAPGPEYATEIEVERKLYECEQGKIMVEFPENVEINNVGSAINSPMDDYAPVVNQSEDLLIFTSRRQENNLNPDVSDDNYPFEDIFMSIKNDTTWSDASNIGQPVNTLYHDSNVGLSKDGATLFIYKDDNGGDIFEASRDANGQWSEPKPMGKPINTEYAETTVTLSPDGQTLFFASNRKGGYGGLDIWLTHKNNKGEWDDPENLGEEINTALNEDGPFIGYDGKTLYFSSAGGEGMGGYDIYRVTFDSLSNSWDAPENMGYPINTPDHDIYFVPTKDGKNAYYSSVRDDGYGNSDIYMLKIPEELHHQEQAVNPHVKLIVKVYDAENNPVDGQLGLNQENGNEKLSAFRNALGEYSFISGSKEARIFQLSVSSDGFEAQKIIVPIPAVGETSSTMDKSVYLVRKAPTKPPPLPPVVEQVAPRATSKKLRNIYFDFDTAIITSDYNDKVDRAVSYLESHPAERLLLEGHTDFIGAERYNSGLSKRRAESVKKALMAKGIDSSRIQTKGEGAMHPLAANDQEKEGRELNRRVEFKVLH